MIDVNSEAELRNFLKPGTSTDEIAARCGDPSLTSSLPGREMWLYSIARFPKPNQPGTYVDGFSVIFTNGQLSHWGYSYVVVEGETIKTEALGQVPAKDSGVTPKLEFFIVQKDPVIGGRYINTEKLPELGYVALNSDLAISHLQQMTLEERLVVGAANQKETNWCFKLTLPANLASKLRTLTAANVSRRMLIAVDDQPLLAPRLESPIESGRLEITLTDRSSMEDLKRSLLRMSQGER